VERKNAIGIVIFVFLVSFFFVFWGAPALAAEKTLATMKPTVWRTQSIITLGHYNTQVFVRFAEEVAKKTDGKLKVEVHASGGLGHPIPKTVSVVRDGLMNVGQLLGAFVNGEFPLADVMELPGLVPEDLELRKQVEKALAPYYEKVLPAQYNQYYLGGWQSDSRVIGSASKKISTLGDLKGIKIRASGPNEVALCKVLGAAPVSIATPEVYSAMNSGTVDACFGADSWYASAKFWEVMKFAYSMQFDGHQMLFTINKDDFDALPPDVKEIVRKAAENAISWVWPEVFAEKKSGREVMVSREVKYFDITPEDWKKLEEISNPIVDEWVKKGGTTARDMVGVIKKVVSQWESKKK
jgi:TRAP-type transport system periplasmic protein